MQWFVHSVTILLLAGMCSAVPAGREFATTFMQNLLADVQDARFMIEVSALPTSRGRTKVTVVAAGRPQEKEVEPGHGVAFKLPDSVEMKGTTVTSQTVLIEASQDVTVTSLNYKKDTADTSAVYPVNDWGTEYYIFTPNADMQGTFKEFSITNHKRPNSVKVSLRGSILFEGKYYEAGSTLNIVLKPFQSAQIQSRDDLSGSKVVSRLPVAVLSGHSCASKYTACNHVYEQLLPVKSWGKEFIIAPLPYHNYWGNHDSIFLQASQSTLVTVNSGGDIQSFRMSPGRPAELFSEWPNSIYVKADKGIQVLFEFNGGPEYSTYSQYYDPFLMTILPLNHFSTSYSLDGQHDFANEVILVAGSNNLADLRIDNSPLPADVTWHQVDGTEYSWARMYYSSDESFHQIAHPHAPFGVYLYGVALANGYGSAASANKPARGDCESVTCEKGEWCLMKDGTPTCTKRGPVIKAGTCWAMGDPHYRTFDGRYYNFMGNCTYTMARNCHVDDKHPAFEVEAHNMKPAHSKVTFVRNVIVKVYGYIVQIHRDEFGLVRMNSTLWNLPIVLGKGKVKLSQSGLSVVMETDFGLTVQYDWRQHLVITVPGTFAGKVCGLCGNFNSNEKDDLIMPNGSLADNVVALGRSWRVPGLVEDAFCRDECGSQCETCETDNIFEHWKAKIFCGILTGTMDGPFRDCHAVIDPRIYHESCLYNVCMGDGVMKFLCDTLQVYSDTCQRAGIKVYDWRRLAGCSEPTCPENSHYESCGSACPATCTDPAAPAKCEANCVEACTCNEGFFRSGNKCVHKAECGCEYEGLYVESGASFWADDQCKSWCKCNAANKKIECQDKGCRPGYECKLADGIRGCHPMAYARCTSSGDPHYLTFDGKHYNFHGTCVYQMAGVCSKDASLANFEVLVQNSGSGKKGSSRVKLVEVNVYGNSIVISKDNGHSVLINGERTNLPIYLNDSKISVYGSSTTAEVKTDFGLQVSYDWLSTASVTVPSSYAGAVCGLCGNYNLDPRDDLKMKDGKQATSAGELGRSWRLAEIPGCVDGCKKENRCPDCDITRKKEFETDRYCGKIISRKGPFHKCHAHLDPRTYFDDCVYDVCLYDGKKGAWCQALHTYTVACQKDGIAVDQWRRRDFCPVSEIPCPDHSHYERCASGCPITCDTLTSPKRCTTLCTEGCECDSGFVLSGNKCVPLAQCGCHYRGKYYKKGEVFHPDKSCNKECICNDGVQCKEINCGPYEKCELKNNVQSCQPFGHGVCGISGDPHYLTFDNTTYDFQGTCTYIAAQTYRLEGTQLKPFTVTVENEKWNGGQNVSVTKLVAVEVYGSTFILRKNQLGMIMLDGIMTTLPLNLNEGQVQAYQDGANDVIVTDFGLKVTYDLVYHVTITVPGNYRGKTRGLCGNFNGDKEDEFLLRDGNTGREPAASGAVWTVRVPGVVCEDGCSGEFCPKCGSARKEIFESDCATITSPKGPFAACHSVIDPGSYYRNCVYDVCLSEGDRKILCYSIAAYVKDCQNLDVKIDSWRTPHFCPLSCPSNSHYDICSENSANPCPGLPDLISYPSTCSEGCACDNGYFFNGTGCVDWGSCGCYYNGHAYKIGDSGLFADCKRFCICSESGMRCENVRCEFTDSCQMKDGTWACHPKQCLLRSGGSFSLFSGMTGTIAASGAYDLIKYCDLTAQSEWFRVVVKVEECSQTGLITPVAVHVFFDNLTVTVTNKHVIWVNGKKVLSDIQPRSDVFVKSSNNTVIVEKKSSFQLFYSHSSEISLTVRGSSVGKVCGACGKITHQKTTDTEVPDSTLMDEYMGAYIAQDFPTCGL